MARPERIGDSGIPVACWLAARRRGLIVPELVEYLDVPQPTAWRFVQRLVREGFLVRTEERRRRTEAFGDQCGGGGIVYHATKQKRSEGEWARLLRQRRRLARRPFKARSK